jgi:hypothetical protein
VVAPYLGREVGSLVDEEVHLALAGPQFAPEILCARGQLFVLTFKLEEMAGKKRHWSML